jgi:hypothetical protein
MPRRSRGFTMGSFAVRRGLASLRRMLDKWAGLHRWTFFGSLPGYPRPVCSRKSRAAPLTRAHALTMMTRKPST